MPRKNRQTMAGDALNAAPDAFITTLREALTECRTMVWSIIQNKQFDGFAGAQNLIKAYDHLNKTLQIFSKFQLPLPGMSEEQSDAGKDPNPALPMV